MTIVESLYALKRFCEKAVKNMPLGTEIQKGDKEIEERDPEAHIMQLPDGDNARKYAPYLIIQALTSQHVQKAGNQPSFLVNVRFIFCVYNTNGEEGSIELLNFMERVHMKLLETVQIENGLYLDVNEPLEMLVYPDNPDNAAPFYAGEMMGTFVVPAIERKVDFYE